MFVRYFDSRAGERPEQLPSPFRQGDPHPLARRAAELLRAELPALVEGKMFGVLVVEHAGRIGYLQAFSGMLDGSWHRDGFVPPAFSEDRRAAFWPAGEAELAALDERIAELDRKASPVRTALAALSAIQATELATLKERHRENRERRRAKRVALQREGSESRELDEQSSADGRERKELATTQHQLRQELVIRLRAFDAAHRDLVEQKAERSRHYLKRLYETYELPNARGETKTLRELFEGEAPGGAADCAAPKLFAYAFRNGMTPIAIAEMWCGPSPATGGRHDGFYYPACRGKCGPILAHMLAGLDVEPAPIYGATTLGDDEPRIVFEDDWLLVVDKPIGMLSVPGRSGALRDSVITRLRAKHEGATIVHRLDLDVSGLMLVAKDQATHAALQKQFALREIDKRYVAILDGNVSADAGRVELALRVDLDDRPRQIFDPIHGKSALTEWRVLERNAGRTRVELVPRTGRTHQLRVHAAHPQGIGVPIVGDALYGKPDDRLMLHAERLAFRHPHTGGRVELMHAAPF